MKPRRHSASIRCLPWATLTLLAAASAVAVDIRISDLSDLDFGSIPPTAGPLTNTMDFCVSLSENGRYNVVARGSGPGDAFVLRNGFWDLPYTLRYSDKPGRRGEELTPGLPLGGLKAKRRQPGQDCRRPAATIEVTISSASLESARSGRYNGVLRLTVSPE